MNVLARLAIAVCVLALAPAGGAVAGAGATVVAYPAAQSIPASGKLPQGGGQAVSLNAAIGEREAAWLVAVNAHTVSATVDGHALGPLEAKVSFGHFVSFGGRDVPDALLPWDGSSRPVERPNQPLYLQVTVPPDAAPGGYAATVTVTVDGKATPIRVSIRVFDLRLPAPSALQGSLLTAFHLVPQAYVAKVDQLFHLGSNAARSAANAKLFSFLAENRIAPADWGFGEPKSAAGYSSSAKWWLDAGGNMVKQGPASFAALRIPISNQRASVGNRIAGISPFEVDDWCDYLHAVRGFWDAHGWVDGHLSYLYSLDEPGLEGMRLVARQADVVHRCWPGSSMLVTGNPTQPNRFLWDAKGSDDVDIWAVLSRRYYGQYNDPRGKLALIGQVRKAGRMVWSTTYSGVAGSPGYSAAEPLSDPRVFLLWNALEGIQGTLYAQGLTSYTKGNPLDSVAANGESVLVYPGADGPVPSARLEQIRDGIEDWDVLDVVRRKRGAAAVRTILADAGLFSATPQRVELACTVGCELHGPTAYSWPQWSHDAATAQKIEAAHLQALRYASTG
ncbi:MAG TPA: glycoside hydrolase domain-containing protein [Gaiellaceae bacterium]